MAAANILQAFKDKTIRCESLFSVPMPGVELYTVLTSLDPRDPAGVSTVFKTYSVKLVVTAELISQG